MTVTRFAPSPTGSLHAGNVRTALVNWLYARQQGGRFVLRLDDTDLARSSEASAQGIRDDLDWLGLTPDAEVRQSDRFALYEAALARLAAAGRAYRAYDTPEQLDLKRRVQASRGLPPVYDRGALALTEADHDDFAAKGVAPHWRFRLETDAPVVWHDLVRGECHIDPASLSDPVVRRADGSWLYMLPSVVDDIDLGITTIVRGEDHVTNSGVQLQMFAALGVEPPALAHLPLLTGADAALSKRVGSEGVAAWAAAGFEPSAILSYLALIGTASPVRPTSVETLIQQFSFNMFGRAPALFDPSALLAVNARLVHELPFTAVASRLPDEMTEQMWQTVRGNAKVVSEAIDVWRTIVDPRTVDSETLANREYLQAAHDALEQLPWTESIWKEWTDVLKQTTKLKGRALFHPLRVALTGQEQGPEMTALLPLIGRDAALVRLAAAAAPDYIRGVE